MTISYWFIHFNLIFIFTISIYIEKKELINIRNYSILKSFIKIKHGTQSEDFITFLISEIEQLEKEISLLKEYIQTISSKLALINSSGIYGNRARYNELAVQKSLYTEQLGKKIELIVGKKQELEKILGKGSNEGEQSSHHYQEPVEHDENDGFD